MLATLKDSTLTIIGHGLELSITYPDKFWAASAYSSVRECCERFNAEPNLTPDDDPKIYAYGEMLRPVAYLKKLAGLAERFGAKIRIKSEEMN